MLNTVLVCQFENARFVDWRCGISDMMNMAFRFYLWIQFTEYFEQELHPFSGIMAPDNQQMAGFFET